MTAALARAVMSLASRCLGADRRDWGLAMQAEFEAAVEDGKPLSFATGCLIAAWREMAKQDEGRLILVNYALALGLLLPMAAIQFEQAIRFFLVVPGGASPLGAIAGAGQNPYLAWSQNSAVPVLLSLWLLLGMAHLRLAWVLVERDWLRVVKLGALIGATMVTLFLFMGVLLLDLTPLIMQITELTIELAAIIGAARWHSRLFSGPSSQLFAF